MGRFSLTHLAIYILRFVWFIVETFLDLVLCLLDVAYGKLLNLKLGTKVIVYPLLMGTVLMLISPFNSTMDPDFDLGPLELQPLQVFKPTEAFNTEGKEILSARNNSSDEKKNTIIHFLVKFSSDTPVEKLTGKILKETLPVIHTRENIEDLEKELLIIEPTK